MEKKLLDAEWTILKAMWGREPQTMHEINDAVQGEQDTGWKYKT
jgi:predicted transcriptional regulator